VWVLVHHSPHATHTHRRDDMSRRRDHHWPTHKANAQRRARMARLYRHRAALDAKTQQTGKSHDAIV